MLVAMVPFFTIAQEKKEIEFNSDKIANDCDMVEYQIYIFTELEKLEEKNSDKSDAYEMNFTSRRTAKYLIRGYCDALTFAFENDMSYEDLEECKNYSRLDEIMRGDGDDTDFYKDMAIKIIDEYQEKWIELQSKEEEYDYEGEGEEEEIEAEE